MWSSVQTKDHSSSPLGSNARHSMWTSVQTKDRSSSPFGFERSTLNVVERSNKRLFVLAFWIRTLDTQCGRAFKQQTVRPRPSDSNAKHLMWSSVQTKDRSSSPLGSNARHSMWTSVQTADRSSSPLGSNARHLIVLAVGRSTSKIFDHTSTRALVNPCQRASKYRSSIHFNERSSNRCHRAFKYRSSNPGVRPRLRIRTLDNHCVRASLLSDVRPRRYSTILQQERSSTHVNERPNIARQPMSTSFQTLLDNPLVRASKLLAVPPQRFSPFRFRGRSTFNGYIHSSTPTTFVLLGQIVRPLDLTDVRLRAFVASPNIDAKQSVVRPHPSNSKRPTLTLPDVRPTRLNGSAFRGLQRPSFFPIVVRHFQGRPYFNTNGPPLGLTLVRPPDVRHLGFNRSANRFINVRQFTQEAFGHSDSLAFGQSISLTYGPKRPAFSLMDVRPPALLDPVDVRPRTPSLIARPSMTMNVHTVSRSALTLNHQCQRASTHRSTIHFNERYKTARQFMSTSVKPPLVNSHQRAFENERSDTARQSMFSSVQEVARSASNLFDLLVSTTQPHMPLGAIPLGHTYPHVRPHSLQLFCRSFSPLFGPSNSTTRSSLF
ncbi:hypothetical protein LR48_Vigan10g257800 [Vigna angularis]|uniref:Uncharacterized protein n=1 Tax=Phaseolus angularis TaxID=3914 RepID=A0A0L9VNP4_PHAAN|nr:hypothetical protein LR48_Vigan10g257800 [Vigna angularis]